MPIIDIFSKRQKRQRGEFPDVYQYNSIPQALRVQCAQIIQEAIGEPGTNLTFTPDKAGQAYNDIHSILCREYGVFTLGNDRYQSDEESVLNFMLQTDDVEKALDVVEVSMRYIQNFIKPRFREFEIDANVKIEPDIAVEELNGRFKEHGVGYQFEGNQMIRVDSTYMHSEVVKNVINLLWNNTFSGANEEFLKAHEHYRKGNNTECLNECLKAFESTMKVICDEKVWAYNQNDTAKKLIAKCLNNQLIPTYLQDQLHSLPKLLESGVPTIRNKLGGHGQGNTQQTADDEITRYALNLTGSNIILLVEQSGIK
jgi:hypothetical protein